MPNNKWKTKLKGDPLPWLLESNPWTKYRTLTNLLELPENSKEVKAAKLELIKDERVQDLTAETSQWFPAAITRHNDAKLSYYKLRMLTDFGLNIKDKGMLDIAKKASAHVENGLFAIRQELPEKGKGYKKPDPNTNEWHALPCDSPLITYSLLSLGHNTPIVMQSVKIIKEKWKDSQGWFCHFFFVDGLFKKLQVGCPMAGLMALEVFSKIPELKESEYAKNAYEPIRFHREYGKTMYYFGRSKKFWAFKYPYVWYNALYLAEVLTRFTFLKDDALVKELIEWIEKSQDEDGKFRPTSMFMNYKGWDFANKKEPSPWITYLCCKILKAYYN